MPENKTSRCWLCGEEAEHYPGDGMPERQAFMALERHLDKQHRGEPFSVGLPADVEIERRP